MTHTIGGTLAKQFKTPGGDTVHVHRTDSDSIVFTAARVAGQGAQTLIVHGVEGAPVDTQSIADWIDTLKNFGHKVADGFLKDGGCTPSVTTTTTNNYKDGQLVSTTTATTATCTPN